MIAVTAEADDSRTAAAAGLAALARTATRTALLLSSETADGVKRKLPGWRPRRANSAASRESATAGVNEPMPIAGAAGFFFWA